ncbi:Methylosome subunit pICln [Coemansia sp. Benny D160-2]|nr:Methylosome subunit pICln [Coemansia sp. Benny D160-2]
MPVIQLRSLPADIARTTGTVRFTADVARIACAPPSAVVAAYGAGAVYVCVDRLVYYSHACGRGFALDYPSIAIHAVASSRHADGDGHSESEPPHLYCQLDAPFPGTRTRGAESDHSEDDDDDDEVPTELFFYPLDDAVLDGLFKAMSECSELNPGPNDSSASEEEEEEASDSDPAILGRIASFDPSAFITSPDHLDRLTPEGRAVLAHLESVISASSETGGHAEHGRFDDAPEDAP